MSSGAPLQAQRRENRTVRRAAWKKPQPDSARLEGLLDHAAVEFNARGIAGARLARIAAAAGVGRAALYYYIDSREDLAFRCYQRACRTTAADLAEAAGAVDGLRRLEQFLLLSLDPRRAPTVVLSETRCLDDERRAQIDRLHTRNLRELRRFIEDGVADGSIRDCDTGIVAQALFGMVSWVPLAGAYVQGAGAGVRAHAAQALWDLVENGTAARGRRVPPCPLDFSRFVFQPGNVFDRRDAAAHKVELLLQTASRLFNQRGIDGTSLDDITAALGATKGAFYHHLPEKKALILRCVQRGLDFYERFVEAAERAGRNGLERSMFGLHLNVQAQASAQGPLSPLTGLDVLPPNALRGIRQRTAALEASFETFNRAGIADGSLRRFDVSTLSLAGAGAFGWIPKWRDPEHGPAPRVIADEIVDLFVRGLRRQS
jgi:AcrR family transcriptional regulator